MILNGACLTLLIALVSAQPVLPTDTPSPLPSPDPQLYPAEGYAIIAPQVFTVSANTWQIINQGPWGAVYGIPLCNPQMYLAGGYSVTVTRQFPYVPQGAGGTSTRFILFGYPFDSTGDSWILDNGYNDGKNFAPLPRYVAEQTGLMPTYESWPWLTQGNLAGYVMATLYLLVQNTIDYSMAQPAPYNILVEIKQSAHPTQVKAVYPYIPLVKQRPDNQQSLYQGGLIPLAYFQLAMGYCQPQCGAIMAFYYVMFNVRQLVSPFSAQSVVRVKYPIGCPTCGFPGRPIGSPPVQYKIGLPVCPPLGLLNYTVRVIVSATNPGSFFNVYACSPEQAWSSFNDPSGYGCGQGLSPPQWTDARGSLYSDIQLYNQSFVWVSLISRAQFTRGSPAAQSQFLVMATSYPGANLTQQEYSETFAGPDSLQGWVFPYYSLWQQLWAPGGAYLPTDATASSGW